MDGASFLSWGQGGGRRKGTGGKKIRAGASLIEVNLPNTSVRPRPTQNIRFNEHLPHFLFPPLSTTKLLTGFGEVPVPVHYIQQQW